MASRLSSPEREPSLARKIGEGLDLHHSSFRKTRSRRKRKMQEMEEKRRIRGDSHWSKLLQVNSDPNGFRHKRCIRMCRSFNVSQPAICRGLRLGSRRGTDRNGALREIEETTDTSCPPPDSGILASIATRIRHWLQSKRKYEVVSPVNDTSGSGERKGDKSGGDIDHGVAGASGMVRGETIKEDYLIISQINNYHPELKRSGGSNPLGLPVSGPCVPRSASTGVARTSGGSLTPPTVISRHATPTHTSSGGTSSFYPSPGTSSKSTTGHHQQYHTQQHQNSHQHPVVDINIEFADAVAVKPRSHFASNPLKLDQNQTPKTAIMTPATRALSRSQQLRQSRNKYMKLLQKAGQLSPGRTPLTGTISAPAKHGIGEKGSSPIAKRRQIKTWPLPGRKQLKSDDDESVVGDSEMELPFIQEMSYDRFGLRGKSSLKDFSIDFKDLNLGELNRQGRRCKLYKGRWHGDVIVHVFGELRQKDKDAFWANLGKLCRIRHENIILFMAACTSQPNLAVVTCNPQGKSLYEFIHVQREKMTMHTKIQVLRQIALGMGYLHAKGIVLRKLNTKNVFIGHKVKVSAMDFGFPDSKHDRANYGSIPRGHLTYIAPEIMCTIRVLPPRLMPSATYSPETDVFAFGTVMYEVFACRFPFHGAWPEKVIWQVCAGHRQILYSLKCSTAIKSLIEDCWAHEPLYRPEFRELCKDLQRHSPLHKKHSSSEPERLNRATELFDV